MQGKGNQKKGNWKGEGMKRKEKQSIIRQLYRGFREAE